METPAAWERAFEGRGTVLSQRRKDAKGWSGTVRGLLYNYLRVLSDLGEKMETPAAWERAFEGRGRMFSRKGAKGWSGSVRVLN